MLLRRMIDHVRAQNWTAIFLDFVIVVAGVYIGIYLGNVRDAQKYDIAMRQSLQALESELRSDLERLDEIITWQTAKTEAQQQLVRLLGADNPEQDELGRLMGMTFGANDTFYPSSSAYQAMKTGGYLAALPDADLRAALTRLYERDFTRQNLNGDYYDQVVFDISNTILVYCWDTIDSVFMTCGENSAAILRNGIIAVSGQGDFYLNLITGIIRPGLINTLTMIDEFQNENSS